MVRTVIIVVVVIVVVAPTAAPLRPQAGVLRGSGLYTVPSRALLDTPPGRRGLRIAPLKRCAGSSVVRA
jgi:hypothetical protein